MVRGSDGVISFTFGDLERSDQGQLQKNRVPVRVSAIVTKEHLYKVMVRESDGVISLTSGDLSESDQSHLLKSEVAVRDSRYCSYRTLIRTHLYQRSRIG